MQRYIRTIAILILALGRMSASADTAHTLPPPRWQVALNSLPLEYPQYVQVKTVGPALLISHYATVIALDRTNGKELWRHTEKVETQPIAPVLPTNPPSAFPAARAAVGKTERHIHTYWSMLASGVIESVGPIAFILETQTIIDPDSSSANGERRTETHNEVAVQAMTGQPLWRSPLDDLNRITTLQGNLLIDYKATEAKSGQTTPLRYRDAATGATLDAKSPQGHAAIQLALPHQDSSAVLFSTFSTLYTLDLEAGTATCLYVARSYLLSSTFYPTEGRIVLYNNADDDGVGHSVWPRFVECTDRHGNKIWGFPKELHFLGAEEMKTVPEPYSIAPMTPCRACGSVLCVSDRAGANGKCYWYGLDVRDGHQLWKSAMAAGAVVVAEAGRGFLLATSHDPVPYSKSSLAWMDGRNGKLYDIAQAPPVANLFLDGDDLFLLDTQGNLLDYSLKVIQGLTSPPAPLLKTRFAGGEGR